MLVDLNSPPDARAAGSVRNSFVLSRQKIVYVPIGKNATTTVLWMLAQASGQDPDRFYRGRALESTRAMMIHQPWRWRGTARLSDLPAARLRRISGAAGWFVFSLLRDPCLRVWSAWQSKFLAADPVYTMRFGQEPWFPRTPSGQGEILESWDRFLRFLSGPGGARLLTDHHFMPQADRLCADVVPYTRVYDVGDFRAMTRDLTEHLADRGQEVSFDLVRENDTPLRAGREVFADGRLEMIERVYRDDFERFGRWPSRPAAASLTVAWSDEAVQGVVARRQAHERMIDLHARVPGRDPYRSLYHLRTLWRRTTGLAGW